MPCHGLFPNNPRSHCMCGLFPEHVNTSFARTALSGLPHGHLSSGHEGAAALARTAMKPSTFLWGRMQDIINSPVPYSFEETHTRWLLCHARIFLWGRKLSYWHMVSDSFIVWRGWVTSATLHWLLRLLSVPVFPSFYPCPSGDGDAVLTQG